MFDSNVYIENSARKVDVGLYEISSHVPYYRSIPLSMINDIKINVDDEEIERDTILISPDSRNWFSLSEAKTVVFHKWEYSVGLKVRFKSNQLLSKNVKLKVTAIARTAYIPVPLHGEIEKHVDFD